MSRLAVCCGEELCKRGEMVLVCSSGNGFYSLGKLDRLYGCVNGFGFCSSRADVHAQNHRSAIEDFFTTVIYWVKSLEVLERGEQ